VSSSTLFLYDWLGWTELRGNVRADWLTELRVGTTPNHQEPSTVTTQKPSDPEVKEPKQNCKMNTTRYLLHRPTYPTCSIWPNNTNTLLVPHTRRSRRPRPPNPQTSDGREARLAQCPARLGHKGEGIQNLYRRGDGGCCC
jgi:hypothetical protein